MESFIDNGRNSVHTAGAKRATFDGNDFHEMVVQVHQNPHWDGAGTSLLCEVASICMDPFTEPEFYPLLLHASLPPPPQMSYTNATRKNSLSTACSVAA